MNGYVELCRLYPGSDQFQSFDHQCHGKKIGVEQMQKNLAYSTAIIITILFFDFDIASWIMIFDYKRYNNMYRIIKNGISSDLQCEEHAKNETATFSLQQNHAYRSNVMQ